MSTFTQLYSEDWLLTVSRWQREAASRVRERKQREQHGECFVQTEINLDDWVRHADSGC